MQSVGHLTRKQRSCVQYPVWPNTFISPSADSRGAVVSYWQKYVHEVWVNNLGLSLPRKNVARLTDRPNMTFYCGCKTTTQQQQQLLELGYFIRINMVIKTLNVLSVNKNLHCCSIALFLFILFSYN